ncbi:MAG: hypothetical protein DI535_08905 [Citrobacter freundii]|nr:MAG: hypothetical protein DI535_08905 [Citrobacter freundii]
MSLAFGIASIALISYACKKNDTSVSQGQDQEKVLYTTLGGRTPSTASLFLGDNVKRVTAISYQHSLLDALRSSDGWKRAIAGESLDLSAIRRTYVFNSDVSLITIPVRSKGNVQDYFNVYIQDKRTLITRLSEIRNADGLTTYKVQSAAGELYYQFDLNDKNQLGNWKFDRDIPKIFTSSVAMSAGRDQEPCAKKKFYSCMNCLIIDVCGSDWLCTIACGLAVPSCVGGAALVCLLAS